MSTVTNVIVAFGLPNDEAAVVRRMNELLDPFVCGESGLLHLNPTDHYGGTKALEVDLAIGAFDGLDIDGWLHALGAEDWKALDCFFFQVLIQAQENDGFGSTCIYPGNDWNPGYWFRP